MPTIEERLDAVARNLELTAQFQQNTEKIVNLLAEDQAKSEKRIARLERVMQQIAVLVKDHEERLRDLED
ncbi:MAG TPA: hypothetical protein VK670_08660 [Silvibacterium sp.]|nr:hypothetical protein [Silvibacterium sp.]